MQVRHWTIENGSGMHRVAETLAAAETALGITSGLADPTKPETWDAHVDADIHVVHTHFPDVMAKRATKPLRVVWVGHGTPDHVFQSAVEEAGRGSYGHGDAIQLMLHWLKVADARVTFWPRHKWMYDRMLTKGARPTDLVPMGVDTAFWSGGESAGKFAGTPSVLTCENPHEFKWPYDLLVAWPALAEEYPEIRLHGNYIPNDMHRAFFPFFNALGSTYTAYLSPIVFDKANLRNALKSVDFFCGLVRYGDHNPLSLEAAASGCKTISYAGNPYATYWVPNGDQRELAKHLLTIFKGDATPRQPDPIPDIHDTATAMVAVYRSIQ